MTELKTEYILSRYEELTDLGHRSASPATLVKHRNTGRLYVRKTLDPAKLPIYEFLKNNPHPNLVSVTEILKTETGCITIEEYIRGQTLHQLLTDKGPLPEAVVCRYILNLCAALKHIHQADLIHRDINPNNLIISTDGVLHLIDFNISRSPSSCKSADTTLLGTVGYAAPEQFGFSQTDARTDIYSAGILMNVMLTSGFPNHNRWKKQPLARIISRCTEMDARNRYHSVPALEQDLTTSLTKLPAPPVCPAPYPSVSIPASLPSEKSWIWKTVTRMKQNYELQKEHYQPKDDAPRWLRALRLIPGLRTGFPFKIAPALPGYIFLISMLIVDLAEYTAYGPFYFIMESIVLSLIISFQSCAAGLANTMSDNGSVNGTAGRRHCRNFSPQDIQRRRFTLLFHSVHSST